ncbi:MAG: hypothetical protein WBX00_30010 [Isosphaeraceae bacterium]
MYTTRLEPAGDDVEVGWCRLRTPGLEGDATARTQAAPGTRAGGSAEPALAEAMARNNVELQEAIEIEGANEVPVGAYDLRTKYDEPAIALDAPERGNGWGQFVLAVDEAGVATWNFADPSSSPAGPAAQTRSGSRMRTYLIRRAVPAAGESEMRGPFRALTKKILEVLVFPLIDPKLGEIGEHFAKAWESNFRPYRVRDFTPESYRCGEPGPFLAEDWERLAGGPALLLIHGTFSRAHSAFCDLPKDYIAQLHKHYQGRVFAFDHYTLSEDPRQNAEWFLKQIPNGVDLDLHVVCHSRGGLVARALVEKQSEFSLGSRKLGVNRVVHVAVPNAGTPLTDTPHLNDLIDTYTNIFDFLPDSPTSLVLDGLFVVAKQLAANTVKGLDGLQAMLPTGRFLREWLNVGTVPARYFALASNYRPSNPGLLSWASDRLFSKIFLKAENDLVVPTASVYDRNGSAPFPIADARRLVFSPEDGVTHGGYFAHERARKAILDWLTEP